MNLLKRKVTTEAENISRDNYIVNASEGLVEDAVRAPILSESSAQVRGQWPVVLILVLSDLVLASLFWALAFIPLAFIPFIPYGNLEVGVLPELTVAFLVPNAIVWVAIRALAGLYPGYGLSPAEELRRQTYATVTTLAVTSLVTVGLLAVSVFPAVLVTLNFLERLLLAPLARHFVKHGLKKIGLWGKPVVVFGAGGTGEQLVRTLKEEWGLGLRPAGVFDFRQAPRGGILEGVSYGGTVVDALNLAQKQRINTVIFAMPYIRREHMAKFVHAASRYFRHVLVVPNLIGITTSVVVARDLAGTFAVEIKHNLLDPWSRRVKRAFDLAGTVIGGLLISPLLFAIAILIKLTFPGPVFYKQIRLGAEGKHFSCWKFRTMHPDAGQILTKLLQSDPNLREEWEKEHKLRKDPRITPIGHFLRKTSLDELPQLWNVLRGEMSLVGPRPIVDAEVPKYAEAYELYQRVGPGMTGLWQVSGRSETTYEERVALDAYYVRNWSVWLDFIILARTVKILIFRVGAY